MIKSFPLPAEVGAYGSKARFDEQRMESGQWVFWEDRVAAVLSGRYQDIRPLHVELSPTYLCNFSCPWCSCRTARETWVGEDVFSHPKASPESVMSEERAQKLLSHLAKDQIGIQWVGGEPTIHPALYRLVNLAHEMGLQQCIYTNGAALSERRSASLLEAEVAFVRVSLNAVTKEIHELHHDYLPVRGYAERVLTNLEGLVRMKQHHRSRTEVGVSVVVDERNLDDVVPTCEYVVDLCSKFGAGAVDFVIIRPTYQFYDAQLDLGPSTVSKLAELVESGSRVASILSEAGVKAVVPQDSFRSEQEIPSPGFGHECLSGGLFGEVTPKGDAVLCSDRYGNPDFFVGNLVDKSLDEVWGSEKRKGVFQHAETTRCFKTSCPRNGRGYFFNKVFHDVERLRKQGRLNEVELWIDDLRATLPVPRHSFFI